MSYINIYPLEQGNFTGYCDNTNRDYRWSIVCLSSLYTLSSIEYHRCNARRELQLQKIFQTLLALDRYKNGGIN